MNQSINLRPNQIKALQVSIDNDFESGIHFHATGTGKSWIAMNIIKNYNEKYPNGNILWICEKKSILIEQFNMNNIKERNFLSIIKKFNVLNFSDYKLDNWYNSVNSSKYWNKPLLLIINRAYLVSSDKYKKIKVPINLIIHDECHTIINETTRLFYEHYLNSLTNIIPKCIGFSATPEMSYKPYDNILSQYSIYDSFMDDVIVPPKIKWFTCEQMIDQNEIISLTKQLVEKPHIIYKKIIIWCGMIELCTELAKKWQVYFSDYLICIDTSEKNNSQDIIGNYDTFKQAESKAILFCACKHREGSDIKNLDCCIFLDKVENRSPKVFVQSIGRVLRLDANRLKKFGLIIDIKAKNSYAICNKLNDYLKLPNNIFPWKYSYITVNSTFNGISKLIKINTLTMTKLQPVPLPVTVKESLSNPCSHSISKSDIEKLFIRTFPSNLPIYKERLAYELNLLERKNLFYHLIQAIQILKITKNMPHVTRGSCGSSLVCYLLGISHIDPILNNIKFARFLNEYRNNLPDIDLDFPHNLRDEVFLKIELQWPGKVARISNHVHYHEKSALRQAIRNAGFHKFIAKNDINKEISSMPKETQKFINDEKKKLDNTFKCYSLHCGGIVYYPDGVPEDNLINKNSSSIKQVKMNKHEVAKDKNFKIDILSSRGLSQLYEIHKFSEIDFEEFKYDKKTFDMLHRGDNAGITLAESPLMRIALMKFKPTSLYDLAVCLSIIRPAAKDARNIDTNFTSLQDLKDVIIFDDDAIDIISKVCKVSEEDADKYRRGFAKGDKESISDFKRVIDNLSNDNEWKKNIMRKLSNLSRYGFCKAHAFSYAQLVWKLAYMKAHHPYEFWKATLNNCDSSYKKWVHLYEARRAGVDVYKKNLKKDDVSIYAVNRRKKIINYTPLQQLKLYGYWDMIGDDFFPECYLDVDLINGVYKFNGIIASSRLKKTSNKDSLLMLFIGVYCQGKKYIQVNINNYNKVKKYFDSKMVGIRGSGKCISQLDKQCDIVTCDNYTFY
jgi:hypothetical protein